MRHILSLILLPLLLVGCSTPPRDLAPYSAPVSTARYEAPVDDYDTGYAWAEYEDISSFDACQDHFGTSDAEDGCNEYVKENYSGYQDFGGYECTEDCSGHEAGYAWAEEVGIIDADDCGGGSDSFVEGCMTWAEEQ